VPLLGLEPWAVKKLTAPGRHRHDAVEALGELGMFTSLSRTAALEAASSARRRAAGLSRRVLPFDDMRQFFPPSVGRNRALRAISDRRMYGADPFHAPRD